MCVNDLVMGSGGRLFIGGMAVRGFVMADRHCSNSRWRFVLEVLLGLVITNGRGCGSHLLTSSEGHWLKTGVKAIVDPIQADPL